MKNRPLTHKAELDEIILKCQFCNAGMVDEDNLPYVIPMNFGYDGENVYLHGSATGKKINTLTAKPDICLTFSTDHELRYVNEDVACSWSMRYRSVLVHGKVEFVDDLNEKVRILNIIMKHYSGKEFKFNDPAVKEVKVMKVNINKMEGRAYGY